jgi:TfoX/Sxy family transcriptional regulator of competence genes
MAVDKAFVEYLANQMDDAGAIRYRAMFGGYAIYCNDKVVALVGDDQIFVKATEAGRNFIGEPVEAPAYTGAKNSFLIEDQVEDKEWLSELVRLTEQELPKPKPKKKKVTK